MTKKLEDISAFMDGESTDKSVIDSLNEDAELSSAWSRYHIMRSAMRNEAPSFGFTDISANIAAQLENEPTVLAPQFDKNRSLFSKVTTKVVPFAKQTGQFAVAASVAAAVIVGVQVYNQPEAGDPFVSAPVLPPQGGLSPVSLNQTRVLPTESKQEMLETRRQIHALISDHQQQVDFKSAEGAQEKDEDKAEVSSPE